MKSCTFVASIKSVTSNTAATQKVRVKLPPGTSPGQILTVSAPGTAGNVRVQVPPGAVAGQTLEFTVPGPSSGAAKLPTGFPSRTIRVGVPAGVAAGKQLRVVVPSATGSTAKTTVTVTVPPGATPPALTVRFPDVFTAGGPGGAGASGGSPAESAPSTTTMRITLPA